MLSDAHSTCSTVTLGRIGYGEGVVTQRAYAARRERGEIPDTLLLCEHPPVYTIGNGADSGHILDARDIEVHASDRGGDVTYHGPGQIVGYVIADVRARGQDLHRFCRDLEEIMICALGDFDVAGEREEGLTGVWIGTEKIGALGVRVRHWVTTHGFALNVGCDLSPFGRIVPCGIFDRGVTSMERQLGRPVELQAVRAALAHHFEDIFGG